MPYPRHGLDPILHAETRLAIVAVLFGAESPVDFTTLRDELALSGGNLFSHLRALERAGVVSANKDAPLGRLRTVFSLTPHGRDRVSAHARAMRELAAALGA
jgi:DNA-binding MarR family transcriptional regulator